MDDWYPIQVKQKDKVGRPDIDSFEAVMMREERDCGYFVGSSFTSDALREIRQFQTRTGRKIVPLTVPELLEAEGEALPMKKPVLSSQTANRSMRQANLLTVQG